MRQWKLQWAGGAELFDWRFAKWKWWWGCMQLTSQLYTFTRNRSFFLLYSHAMCTTSLKVITWPGQKGERISSRERSDGPKSSLTGCTNTSGGAPPCDSLPRQTIVQSLEQHWVDKSRRKRLGGPGELTVSHSFFFFFSFSFFALDPSHPLLELWDTCCCCCLFTHWTDECHSPPRSHCLPATS